MKERVGLVIESIVGWVIFGVAIYFGVQLVKARLSRTTIHNHVTHAYQGPVPAPAPVFYPVFIPLMQGGWNGPPVEPYAVPVDGGGVDDSALHGLISDYYRDHPPR
jgi:hypothetical protein